MENKLYLTAGSINCTCCPDKKECDNLQEKYWSFYMDDEFYDAEFESRDEAYKHADGIFAQQCEDDGMRGTATKRITIVKFYTDDEGEMIPVFKRYAHLEYEYYQGDYAEHNTMHNLV